MIGIPRKALFWAVALGHMTNDIFMSMGPVLLVFLSTTVLPIKAAQIGLAISAQQVMGSISQPYFGWRGDRTGGRWLGAGGVTWVVVMSMLALLLAQTGNYWLMLIPFALSGLGSGAFHPVGAKYAAEVTTENQASSVAYFFLFGQTGLASGPAIAGFLLDPISLPAEPELMKTAVNSASFLPIFALSIFAIPGVALMATTIPTMGVTLPTEVKAESAPRERAAQAAMMAIILMVVLVFLRSVAQLSAVNFIPVLFERKGWSPTEYGLITSSFWIASAIAGIIFGRMADHYDRRYVVAGTLIAAVPAVFFLPLVDSKAAAFALALTAGTLLGASFSIIVLLAQKIIPAGKGFASGSAIGFIFISGAIGNVLIGALADGPLFGDGIGLDATFQVIAVLALIAGLLALTLPKTVND